MIKNVQAEHVDRYSRIPFWQKALIAAAILSSVATMVLILVVLPD